jgi:hypothetical protein
MFMDNLLTFNNINAHLSEALWHWSMFCLGAGWLLLFVKYIVKSQRVKKLGYYSVRYVLVLGFVYFLLMLFGLPSLAYSFAVSSSCLLLFQFSWGYPLPFSKICLKTVSPEESTLN